MTRIPSMTIKQQIDEMLIANVFDEPPFNQIIEALISAAREEVGYETLDKEWSAVADKLQEALDMMRAIP